MTALAALKRKRAEIAGLIAELQKKIQGYQDDLVHLDHALRLFDPTISGWDTRAKRPKAHTTGYFQHGELSPRIYEAFRGQEWVSAAEIADKAMQDKRLSDKRIRAMFITTFLVRPGQMQRSGRLAKTSDGRGRSVRWKLRERYLGLPLVPRPPSAILDGATRSRNERPSCPNLVAGDLRNPPSPAETPVQKIREPKKKIKQ